MAAEAAGLEPNVGRAYRVGDEYFSRDFLRGTKAGDAAYIYRDGLLVGGLDERRAHVHLVRSIGEWTDESRGGIRCQGIKRECDAYVMIDAEAFLTRCTLDEQPVTMFENTNGVVLTAGA